HTRLSRDWSSDVCSSDLSYMAWAAFFTWLAACRPSPQGVTVASGQRTTRSRERANRGPVTAWRPGPAWIAPAGLVVALGQSSKRPEERRGGGERRPRWRG